MNLLEALRTSFESLMANKSRSILTMLGVIIGVGAVLVVVAIGEGLKTDTLNRIRSMGANLIMVFPGGGSGHGRSTRPGRLTEEDFEKLASDAKHLSALAPVVQTGGNAKYRNLTHSTTIVGTNSDWTHALSFEVAHGRFLAPSEERARSRVAVVGQEVADELFYGRPLLGEFIRINGVPFEVIGILETKGGGWGNPDDQIIIPMSTARQRLVGSANLSRIYASAASETVVPEAIESIKVILRKRHRVTEMTEDFRIRDQSEFLDTMTETTGQLTMFVGGIALVSLIVGGVGIMNIMLVSVTERTREIGTRLAIGALEREVLLQFLVEAVVLSSFGGIFGIALGTGAAAIAAGLLGVPFIANPSIMSVAFLFSGAVGVIFGYFPARQAARMDPIDALRHE